MQNSPVLNAEEKQFFTGFSAEDLFTKPSRLYVVLDAAYKSSLVALFLYEVSFPQEALLKNKVLLVRKHIQSNKEMTTLTAIGRQITCFPNELCYCLPNLTKINLCKNKIFLLPASVGELSALKEIFLELNLISSVPDSLEDLSKLVRLDLRYNNLTSISASLRRLLEKTKADLHTVLAKQWQK